MSLTIYICIYLDTSKEIGSKDGYELRKNFSFRKLQFLPFEVCDLLSDSADQTSAYSGSPLEFTSSVSCRYTQMGDFKQIFFFYTSLATRSKDS